MNIGTPDFCITPDKFVQWMQAFRTEVQEQDDLVFREIYVDRCFLEPYYILAYRSGTIERGDDLYDQPLSGTDIPCVRMACLTREAKVPGGTYWKDISRSSLLNRLDNFTNMYMGDYLQPPGFRGDLFHPRERHDIFGKKRFIYKIESPRNSIVSIGPKMYAGLQTGAVCGTVFDETGLGLDAATVELLVGEKKLARQTTGDGLFWFSRVPPGPVKITVPDRSCIVRIIRYEEFGALKGWLADQNGNPVINAEVKFKAPDDELFNAVTDLSGKFTSGPVPTYPVQNALLDSYPYIMSIPDFLFSVRKDIKVNDATVGGKLKNSVGAAVADKQIILKRENREVARTRSDATGSFVFVGLPGGQYQLEVPGSRTYVAQTGGGAIEGKVPGASAPAVLEIFISDGTLAGGERTDAEGRFHFSNVAPGTYELKYSRLQE